MSVEYIEREFTYKIPDTWRGDTFNLGKTGTFTYKGPRFLTFQIDVTTGKEAGWCLWEERDIERPCALDIARVTVDADASDFNALLCEIANDQGNQDQVDFRTTREWVILHQAPPGYQSLWEPTAVEPRDIYDEFDISYDFETGEWTLPIKTLEREGWRMDITWDEVRQYRNRLLEDTDGKLSEDMPDSIKQTWIDYRNLLRDLPTALAEFEPWLAAHMFPSQPQSTPPSDGTNKIMYTGGGIQQG